MSKIAFTPNASGTGTFTIASPDSNTNRTLTLPDADGALLTADGDGSNLTGIDTAPTTAGVLSATAGATAGAVGTYAFLSRPSGVSSGTRLGTVLSGSSLEYASTRNGLDIDNMAYIVATSIPSGTWMAMGDTGNTLVNHGLCVWLRIS